MPRSCLAPWTGGIPFFPPSQRGQVPSAGTRPLARSHPHHPHPPPIPRARIIRYLVIAPFFVIGHNHIFLSSCDNQNVPPPSTHRSTPRHRTHPAIRPSTQSSRHRIKFFLSYDLTTTKTRTHARTHLPQWIRAHRSSHATQGRQGIADAQQCDQGLEGAQAARPPQGLKGAQKRRGTLVIAYM